MSCITLTEKVTSRTLVISIAHSYCMNCEEEYVGGASCNGCSAEFEFIVFDYPDPSPATRKDRLCAFAEENGLSKEITFLGYMAGPRKVTPEV